MVTSEPVHIPLSRWVTGVLAVVAIVLIPWILYLTFTLPSRHVTFHYDLAWVGFDVALTVSMAATAWAALRGSRWLVPFAAVSGTMLCCDAWFDVVTSHAETTSSKRSPKRRSPSCRSPRSAPSSSMTPSGSSQRPLRASGARQLPPAALRADQFEAVRERAALEDEGEPVRSRDRSHVAEDRLGASDAERERVIGVVDVRGRHEPVVEDDRVVLRVELVGELAGGAILSGDDAGRGRTRLS